MEAFSSHQNPQSIFNCFFAKLSLHIIYYYKISKSQESLNPKFRFIHDSEYGP